MVSWYKFCMFDSSFILIGLNSCLWLAETLKIFSVITSPNNSLLGTNNVCKILYKISSFPLDPAIMYYVHFNCKNYICANIECYLHLKSADVYYIVKVLYSHYSQTVYKGHSRDTWKCAIYEQLRLGSK